MELVKKRNFSLRFLSHRKTLEPLWCQKFCDGDAVLKVLDVGLSSVINENRSREIIEAREILQRFDISGKLEDA
jgi:hypothetical protein